MFDLKKIFGIRLKNDIADILKTDKEKLNMFEKAYTEQILSKEVSDNMFEKNAKQAAEEHSGIIENQKDVGDIVDRIVDELLSKQHVLFYDGNDIEDKSFGIRCENKVTSDEILSLPEELRPWLTGSLMKVDIPQPSYDVIAQMYKLFKEELNEQKKKHFYDIFRQGLDIMNLDSITYQMIGTNPNSMGYWFPSIVMAVKNQEFFKVPKTKIIKVPLPMLQLTRLEYDSMSRTTLDIVDEFCHKAFELENDKDYFIKTGTYSSKFDFRNAKVHGDKEVRELGEYLLFIHYQACQMASPFNNRKIHGVSTTNEWVVREFIHDKENNPCIYKGLPLHTEYRVFVDFDAKSILGITPYWDAKVMEQRFGHESDSDNPHNVHDYIIYKSHKETLMKRYDENVESVKSSILSLIQDVEGLSGQWSIDVMQNDKDFWIIDMALAMNSALSDCVPKGLLKSIEENWIPEKLSLE